MASELPIPVYTSLGDAYPTQEITLKQAARFNDLAEQFVVQFGRNPEYIVRAPGRVNLIGEHIDYALFGVFPTAIEQDILIACGPADDSFSSLPGHVNAQNVSTKYTPQQFVPVLKDQVEGNITAGEKSWYLDIDTNELRWESYVKAGYYGVLNHYFPPSSTAQPRPLNLLVNGTVPPGSGLSSSAAMVVASTLAFLSVNDKLGEKINKGQLVKMAVENERRVGVNSGGMDQAASILSTPNSALYISFYPSLASELVTLPTTIPGTQEEEAVFVCANSLVVSDKLVAAKTQYNLRVVETLLSARLLANYLKLPPTFFTTSNKPNLPTLREVLGAFVSQQYPGVKEPLTEERLKGGLVALLEVVEVLRGGKVRSQFGLSGEGVSETEGGLRMEEIISVSGLDEKTFRDVYLNWVEVEATYFQLYKRAKHVFTESLRVLQFRDLCLAASTTTPTGTSSNSATLRALGELMNASQESCSTLFECSCPQLDELTKICRESGAIGSRLTGAGWGGCTISLVPTSQVSEFIRSVKEKYKLYQGIEEEKLKNVIFATRPGRGAFVYKLTK